MVSRDYDSVLRNESGIIDIDNPINTVTIEPKDVRYDPSDTVPDYVGINQFNYDASTSSETWIIFKFTYSNGLIVRSQKQINVAWDSRTTIW